MTLKRFKVVQEKDGLFYIHDKTGRREIECGRWCDRESAIEQAEKREIHLARLHQVDS